MLSCLKGTCLAGPLHLPIFWNGHRYRFLVKAIAAGFLDGRFDVSGTSPGGSLSGRLIQP
jgi:hypothetical protein